MGDNVNQRQIRDQKVSLPEQANWPVTGLSEAAQECVAQTERLQAKAAAMIAERDYDLDGTGPDNNG
jgi:hypothetical protein